jgi:hypothetical protein
MCAALVAVVAAGLIGAAGLVPMAGAVGGETPAVVTVGTLPVVFNFGVSPKALPAPDPGEAELKVSFEDRREDGGIPSALTTATIGLDKSITLEPRGLPTCWWARSENTVQIQSAGVEDCSDAVVGRVEAKVLIAFAEQTPVSIAARGTIYNGGVHRGRTMLGFEIPVPEPLSAALRLHMQVRPVQNSRIGSEATLRFPQIAGGAGLVEELRFELGRAFRRRGEPVGYVSAECPEGNLIATYKATLVDGSESTESWSRPCASRR